MPRRRASDIISEVLTSAENLRNSLNAVPGEIKGTIRDIALSIVNKPVKRRGRPPAKRRGRPRKKRGRPRKRAKAVEAQPQA